MNPNEKTQVSSMPRFGDIGSTRQAYAPIVAQPIAESHQQAVPEAAPVIDSPQLTPAEPALSVDKVSLPEAKKPKLLSGMTRKLLASSLVLTFVFGAVAISQVIRTQRLNNEVAKNRAYLAELQEQSEKLRSEIADIRMGRKAVLGVGTSQTNSASKPQSK
jgi:cell division protein FtsL